MPDHEVESVKMRCMCGRCRKSPTSVTPAPRDCPAPRAR
jgi:hypothetical protein